MVRFAALLISCMLLALYAAPSAEAQGRIVGRHGDWQIRCERQVGAPSEQCALVQNVEAQDRANVGLTVIFLLTADRQARILRVLAPLGLLLPPGLGLSIDGNEVGAAGFVRCLPEGCIAEVELEDGLIQRFQAGQTATFVIFQTPEEGIGIPISLNGFTAGFEALKSPPPPAEETLDPEPTTPQVVETARTEPVAADRFAALSDQFDDRSELDRLLEDDLFPYVVGGALVLVVLLVIAVILILRRLGGGSRRRARRNADAPPPAADPATPAAAAAAAPEDDAMEPDVAPAQGRPARNPPRLAAPATPRQMEDEPDGPPPSQPGGPRRLTAPRGPGPRN